MASIFLAAVKPAKTTHFRCLCMDKHERSFNNKTGIETGTRIETISDSISVTVFQKMATGVHSQNMCIKVPVAPKGHKSHREDAYFLRKGFLFFLYFFCQNHQY